MNISKREKTKRGLSHVSETKYFCYRVQYLQNPISKGRFLTICALMDVSVGERRHELLVAAGLRVTVAFLRL